MKAFLPLSLLCLCSAVLGLEEQFDEKLSIRSFKDGRVASRFSFTTLLKDTTPRDPRTLDTPDVSQHYTLFPLALGQILREWGVTELHLSLNSGKWDYDHWGFPEEKSVETGAELWAWMGDGAKLSIDERWQGLRNSVAGLFCASLGSMGQLRTTSPPQSFTPEGDLPSWVGTAGEIHHDVRHASLPSEHVCTENLTPFLKLLPCKSHSGIAHLLNPHRLFDADWHGMAVHVVWRKDVGVELEMSFQTVSNPVRTGVGRKQDWSFQSLFDRTIIRDCPVATSSEVLAVLPRDSLYSIRPEPSYVDNDKIGHFNVTTLEKPLNVGIIWPQGVDHHEYQDEAIPFTTRRTLMGSTQERGQLVLTLENQKNRTVHTLYLETMPWFVQMYLHTLTTRVNGVIEKGQGILSNVSYILPIPHGRPATFQALVTLAPRSTLEISMDVSKAFLRYTEHPPDAQRGWDLPPAVLTPLDEDDSDDSQNDNYIPSHHIRSTARPVRRIYTPTLVVDLATPDFSMPYNVIIFSCSVVAFIFGTIFNLVTRKFVIVDVNRETAPTESSSDK